MRNIVYRVDSYNHIIVRKLLRVVSKVIVAPRVPVLVREGFKVAISFIVIIYDSVDWYFQWHVYRAL